MTGEEEWLETGRLAQKIAAILEERGDHGCFAAQRSLLQRRWARGGTLAVLALLATGGSLALATILQHTESDHRAARPARIVPYAAQRPPQAVAVDRTTLAPRGSVASVGIVKPLPVTHGPRPHTAPVPPPPHLVIDKQVESAAGQRAPSPHLAGAALRRALIEDAAKTRALNLSELTVVDRLACRKPDREQC